MLFGPGLEFTKERVADLTRPELTHTARLRARGRAAGPTRPELRQAAVCRPIRTPRTTFTGSKYFPCLAMATDDEGSSDESLSDILSEMGSHSTAHCVDFDDNNNINPPPTWDFMTNDASWHSLCYTMDELKYDRICYCC